MMTPSFYYMAMLLILISHMLNQVLIQLISIGLLIQVMNQVTTQVIILLLIQPRYKLLILLSIKFITPQHIVLVINPYFMAWGKTLVVPILNCLVLWGNTTLDVSTLDFDLSYKWGVGIFCCSHINILITDGKIFNLHVMVILELSLTRPSNTNIL